jgi:diguanylate cyclase
MNNKLTSAELARLTLIQLSKSQSEPTPENFRRIYEEIAGIKSGSTSEYLGTHVEKVLSGLGKENPKFLATTQKILSSLKKQDSKSLEDLLRKLLLPSASNIGSDDWADLLRYLLKQLDVNHPGLTLSRKKDGINRVIINFGSDPDQLRQKIQSLVTSWGEGQSAIQINELSHRDESNDVFNLTYTQGSINSSDPYENDSNLHLNVAKAWRDALIRTIKLIVLPQFSDIPGASSGVEVLINRAEVSSTYDEVDELIEAFKPVLLRAELLNDKQQRMQEALIQMLRLLVSSMCELTVEDKWLSGQIAIVQDIISKPLNIDAIYNAESSLKELILKQSSIKPGLIEAKDTLKNMVNTFVSHLSYITDSTGVYHTKITDYQDQISNTDDIAQLNAILENLVGDISVMSRSAQQSHQAFEETQKKVDEAEKQIDELSTKLDYISGVAHQDFLTGALNRRGMDEAIQREFSRADRHNTPISLAMIDVDHFKKINDSMGHATGDIALTHLVKVVKGVLRSTDILARYGGEEFVILLPGSKQDDAIKVVASIQRDLTKNFFLHNNNRILITFSAGVAERLPNEHIEEILPRADAALYIAKQTGRNRVIGAS